MTIYLDKNPVRCGRNLRLARISVWWSGFAIWLAVASTLPAQQLQPDQPPATSSTQAPVAPINPATTSTGASSKTSSASLHNLSLEQLLDVRMTTESTISRVDEKIDEAAGSVYVYTRKDIQNRGYHSLAELLQTVPGFTVFHRDLDYVMGVRGLSANVLPVAAQCFHFIAPRATACAQGRP